MRVRTDSPRLQAGALRYGMAFAESAIEDSRQFGQPLLEVRRGHDPVILCLHLGIAAEVKSVREVVADGSRAAYEPKWLSVGALVLPANGE